MNCVNCGAPLPPNSNICKFCETLNDTDLRAIGVRPGKIGVTDRICPKCAQPLVHINIGSAKPLFIDRCAACLGMFFDVRELEAALHDNVDHVYDVNYKRIQQLNEKERRVSASADVVRYVKCPICRELMHRRAYGTRSSVIVDTCQEHGVWLDAGELEQLLKWVKAGGKKLQQRRKEEEQRAAEIQRRVQSRTINQTNLGARMYQGNDGMIASIDASVLAGAMRVIFRLLG